MWNPFRPRVVTPTDQDRALARQLLETAQQLLGLTSSPPSNATNSPSPRPLPPNYRIRGREDVVVVDRSRHLELEWETRRNQLPAHVRDPEPVSPAQLSSGTAVTGGFAATTSASAPTADPAAHDNAT